MILLSIISLIITCLFQGIISNYLGYTYESLSIFSTIYILLNLLILKPYFENEKKFFALLISFGLITDIAYTNTFILNTCFFIIVYYFSKVFHSFVPYNFITVNISNLLGIFLYHTLSFLFLWILKFDNYSIGMFLKILSHSVIMTFLYTSAIYFIIQFFYQKLGLKEVK